MLCRGVVMSQVQMGDGEVRQTPRLLGMIRAQSFFRDGICASKGRCGFSVFSQAQLESTDIAEALRCRWMISALNGCANSQRVAVDFGGFGETVFSGENDRQVVEYVGNTRVLFAKSAASNRQGAIQIRFGVAVLSQGGLDHCEIHQARRNFVMVGPQYPLPA